MLHATNATTGEHCDNLHDRVENMDASLKVLDSISTAVDIAYVMINI